MLNFPATKQKQREKRNLELLKKKDGGRVSREGEIEVEAPVEEADGAFVASNDDLSSAAGAALDPPLDFIRNRALSRQFLFEELELPPLVHRRNQIGESDIGNYRDFNFTKLRSEVGNFLQFILSLSRSLKYGISSNSYYIRVGLTDFSGRKLII